MDYYDQLDAAGICRRCKDHKPCGCPEDRPCGFSPGDGYCDHSDRELCSFWHQEQNCPDNPGSSELEKGDPNARFKRS